MALLLLPGPGVKQHCHAGREGRHPDLGRIVTIPDQLIERVLMGGGKPEAAILAWHAHPARLASWSTRRSRLHG